MPTLAESLAALIPLLNTYAPEVIKLLHTLEGTPEQDHQKVLEKVNQAFDEVRNDRRPGKL